MAKKLDQNTPHHLRVLVLYTISISYLRTWKLRHREMKQATQQIKWQLRKKKTDALTFSLLFKSEDP